MLIFTKIAALLLLFYLIEANKTEHLETSLNQMKEEFNYRLNNAIKIQELYEKRIEEMMKQFAGINDKLYDMNSKMCQTANTASNRTNRSLKLIENDIDNEIDSSELGKI